MVRRALVAELAQTPEAFQRAFLYFSHHGVATCSEREPHCSVCPILDGCPEGMRRAGA
jgi:endonuclease III